MTDHLHIVGNSSSLNEYEPNDTISLFSPPNNFQKKNSGKNNPTKGKNVVKAKRCLKRRKKNSSKNGKKKSEKRKADTEEIKQSYTECFNNEKGEDKLYDFDFEIDSEESISLLQDCYENVKSREEFNELDKVRMNTEVSTSNMESDWATEEPAENVNCDKQENAESNGLLPGTATNPLDKSCQVDISIFGNDRESKIVEGLGQHIALVSSIVKLCSIVKSKPEASSHGFCELLNKTITEFGNHESRFEDSSTFYLVSKTSTGNVTDRPPKETVKYLLRSTSVDEAFLHSVSAIFRFLGTALDRNCRDLAFTWRNSIYEFATEMLNKAVHHEPKVRRLANSFLDKIVTSISSNKAELQNFIQETRATFIVVFCSSGFYCEDAIGHIIDRLKELLNITSGKCLSLKQRFSQVRQTKNSYFLLRTLEELLSSFPHKSKELGTEPDTSVQTKESFNVLEMWKKHWREVETFRENKNSHENKLHASKWCEDLDEILVHCVQHIPIVVHAVERCATLARNLVESSNS
ncbi:hypothetical protein RUM43_001448 [Polyplax serrata]|uniref:Uncharacterized protein n=1 Tax=Polyplax serrata TaxID=468196 RepID=A0AAN8SHS6_POLSC